MEEQDIEKNHRNLIDKSWGIRSRAKDGLLGRTLQARVLGSKSSSFLSEIKFSDQEFSAGTTVSNIKYNHPRFQNNNSFYPFYDRLDHGLAKYFVESKTTKSNVDKFLSELLMASLTEKLFYRNADEWMEKLSEILLGILNDK